MKLNFMAHLDIQCFTTKNDFWGVVRELLIKFRSVTRRGHLREQALVLSIETVLFIRRAFNN